jgi:CBS domain containing-hemolysin-like protein
VYIRRCGDGSLRVKGDVSVEDALEYFGNVDFEALGIEEYEGETVSYLIIALLESFPERGEKITLNHSSGDRFELTVESVDDNAIDDVRIVRIRQEVPAPKTKKAG